MYIFCLPSAPGLCISSGVQENVEANPRFSIAGEARGAELIPRGAVPAPGAMASLLFLLLELSVSPAAQHQLLSQTRVPPPVTSYPNTAFVLCALLHNNLKYRIRSEERKVAIHRRLYLNVTTEIQWCRVYLALCGGTMRHQTLTTHTTNRKL